MNAKIDQIKNQYVKYKKPIEETIFFISIVLIVWSACISIGGICYTINAEIHNKIFEYNDLLNLRSHIFRVHSALLMTPLYLLIVSLFKKHIKLYDFALAIVFSFILPTYEWFDNYIHPILFKTHIFDMFLQSGQTVLNPQYTKLLIYVLLVIILLGLQLFKKGRTVDRIFILLISSSVLITVFIFHITIPMGYFKFTKYQLQENLVQQMNAESEELYCKDKSCFLLDKDLNLKKSNKNADIELLKTYSYFTHGIKNFYDKTHKDEIFTSALGDFRGQEFDYIISAAQPRGEDYFIIMDEKVAKKYARHSEIWFSFLTSCAHFIWIFGGMTLLFIHKQRFFRKLSPRLNHDLKELSASKNSNKE